MERTIDSGDDRTGLLVVVAARDEQQRIGATLAGLRRAFPAAVLAVADDGSRDATAALARAAGAQVIGGPHVGKGGAVTRALRAIAPPAGVVLLCDGDLSDSAANLDGLVAAVGDGRLELAVAAFQGGGRGGFGVLLWVARAGIARLCGWRGDAPLSGQRALLAGRLPELLPLADGYGMEAGMTIDAVRAGWRVGEIELALEHRRTSRDPAGFAHRARQLIDVLRALLARR